MLKEAKENNEWGSGGVIRHKIRSGENLGSIARKYRVKVSQLKKWNNLKNSNIRAGRYLKIYK
jgi:membrane-bound lytic murein transglycosylase D